MRKRFKLSRGRSRRMFKRGARRVNRRNFLSVMRGGYRA